MFESFHELNQTQRRRLRLSSLISTLFIVSSQSNTNTMVLPGPEATELCCYFGLLSRGRLGAFIAGLGFVLPGVCSSVSFTLESMLLLTMITKGFILMMLFSWWYSTYNALENPVFKASFLALQPTVVAMVFRATHKISEHAFADPHSVILFSFISHKTLLSSVLNKPLPPSLYSTNSVIGYSLSVLWQHCHPL